MNFIQVFQVSAAAIFPGGTPGEMYLMAMTRQGELYLFAKGPRKWQKFSVELPQEGA